MSDWEIGASLCRSNNSTILKRVRGGRTSSGWQGNGRESEQRGWSPSPSLVTSHEVIIGASMLIG